MIRNEKRDRPKYPNKLILAVKRRWLSGFARVETVARVRCGTLTGDPDGAIAESRRRSGAQIRGDFELQGSRHRTDS
jgi:hypothetical protein